MKVGVVPGQRSASAGRTQTTMTDAGHGHEHAAEEQARVRIASDIHDDTIQTLDAVALSLQHAREAAADSDAWMTLDAALGEVQEASARLRRLMFELMPPLPTAGLRSAVETYCSLMLTPSPLSYEIVGDPPPLSPGVGVLAYRLVQEALRNSARHSGGTHVRVTLETADDALVATVSDDGSGFPLQANLSPTHAGLRIAAQRLEAMGGAVTFDVGLGGRGSAVRFVIPLAEPEPR